MAPIQSLFVDAVVATARYFCERSNDATGEQTVCSVVARRAEASTSYQQFKELVLPLGQDEQYAGRIPSALLILLNNPPPEQG